MDVAKIRIIFLSVVGTVGVVILIENVSPGVLRQVRLYEAEEEGRPISGFPRSTTDVSSKSSRLNRDFIDAEPASITSPGNFINVSDERENDILFDFTVPPERITSTPAREIELKRLPTQPPKLINWAISSKKPVILFWTAFYSIDVLPELTLYKEIMRDLKKCPHSNCVLTNDRSMLSQSGALIFAVTDLNEDDLPRNRSPDQYYIYYGIESPVHLFYDLDPVKSYFNMTMTYRLDSDIVTHSYFQHFNPQVWTKPRDSDDLMQKKDKFAVAFVSNCNPSHGRDIYLNELKRLIPLDIYGRCGSLECSTDNATECDKRVSEYKFYLAFENSVCRDYVTEKIHRAYNHGAVPVVYGGANYSAIFPPRSFINILDFESPQALSIYLRFLDENPKEYARYFDWRKNPETAKLPPPIQSKNLGFCKICTLLNTRQPRHHEVKDLDDWWNGKGWCARPVVATDASGVTIWIKNPVIPAA